MRLPGRSPQVGAYVCTRGVFIIEWTSAPDGVHIMRSVDAPFALKTAEEAADHLVSTLRSAGLVGASVCIALRGFGVAHQSLLLPPATDALLAPVIEREVRRLEPHLGDCVVRWTPLPPLEVAGFASPPQRSFFAIAAPRDVIDAFDARLEMAGHRMAHVTALPVAVQRLLEQFDSGTGTIATVIPLPDAAYIGYWLGGGVRLIVEPPLPQDMEHEAGALAEEVDLGAMFVRQQFRGTNVDRVVLVGARPSLVDLKTTLAERLRIPAKHIEADALTPPGFAALGAVLDARSETPQSLSGASGAGVSARTLSRLELASVVAMFVFALVGFWTITETVRTVRAERALQTALRRVEQDDFGLAPVRATAEQRRLVQNAYDAVRLVAADRVALQNALASIAAVAGPPVRLDSLRLARDGERWQAVLTGDVEATSNARAVQALHDLYRALPERLAVDSVRLDRLSYDQPGSAERADGLGSVSFRLSLAFRPAGAPR